MGKGESGASKQDAGDPAQCAGEDSEVMYIDPIATGCYLCVHHKDIPCAYRKPKERMEWLNGQKLFSEKPMR